MWGVILSIWSEVRSGGCFKFGWCSARKVWGFFLAARISPQEGRNFDFIWCIFLKKYRTSCLVSSPHSGFQWQIKVYGMIPEAKNCKFRHPTVVTVGVFFFFFRCFHPGYGFRWHSVWAKGSNLPGWENFSNIKKLHRIGIPVVVSWNPVNSTHQLSLVLRLSPFCIGFHISQVVFWPDFWTLVPVGCTLDLSCVSWGPGRAYSGPPGV